MSTPTEPIQVFEVGIPNLRHSDNFEAIAAALVSASAAIETASKDATNPHFKSKYADLTSIMDVAKEPLAKQGIAIMQPVSVLDGSIVTVATILMHKSGQWFASELTMRAATEMPQAVGSTITYARRYGLSGILGITADDDDGNAGSNRGTESVPERYQPRPATRPTAPAAAPTPAPKPASRLGQLEAFAAVKADLRKLLDNDLRYYAILGAHGYEKSDQIKTREEAELIYREMKDAVKYEMEHITDADVPANIGGK